MALPSVWISFELVHVQVRTRLVYFYFLKVNFLVKTWSWGRRHLVWLPRQRYICRSKYGCFCLSPQITYLHTKNEEGLKIFISNFASLSWRITLNKQMQTMLDLVGSFKWWIWSMLLTLYINNKRVKNWREKPKRGVKP